MAKFTDGKGRQWKVQLDVGIMQEVKDETDVDLSIMNKDASWVTVLFSEPQKLVSILYLVCQDEIKERGLSPKDFARLFTPDVLEPAGTALVEAIADFFPRSRVAQAIRENLPKMLAKADAEMVKRIEKAASQDLVIPPA